MKKKRKEEGDQDHPKKEDEKKKEVEFVFLLLLHLLFLSNLPHPLPSSLMLDVSFLHVGFDGFLSHFDLNSVTEEHDDVVVLSLTILPFLFRFLSFSEGEDKHAKYIVCNFLTYSNIFNTHIFPSGTLNDTTSPTSPSPARRNHRKKMITIPGLRGLEKRFHPSDIWVHGERGWLN